MPATEHKSNSKRTPYVDRGECIVVKKFATKAQCRLWFEVLLQNFNKWVPAETKGAYFYPASWYMSLDYGRAHHYFFHSSESNRAVRQIPGFTDCILKAAKYLIGPNGPCDSIRARHENLGPYWVEAGIHIFSAEKNRRICEGTIHRDFEGLIPYPPLMFDPETRTFTAVLSIAVPAQGGGLNIWYQRNEAFGSSFVKLMPELMKSISLSEGSLVIFDGFMPHQIQAARTTSEAAFRITGVVHFLYREHPYPHWEYWF